MKNNKRNGRENLCLGILLMVLGVSVLISGEIKGMTLGNERVIPGGLALVVGGWVLSSYIFKFFNKK